MTIADEKKDDEDRRDEADEKKPDEKKPEAAAEAKKDATPEDKKTTVPVPAGSELVIDFDGLAARVDARAARRPTTTAACRRRSGHLIYTVAGAGYYGRDSDREPSLRIFAFKDRKETTLVPRRRGYALSADGRKLLVRRHGRPQLRDVRRDADRRQDSKKTVSTAGLMSTACRPRSGRRSSARSGAATATSSTSTNMHGYDWDALRKQYEPLLAHVAHRSDLNYVIGEMISELNVQHAYIDGGDFELPPRAAGGAARRALRARRGDAARYQHRADLRAARTRRSATARR